MPYGTECPGQCWRLQAARDAATINDMSSSSTMQQNMLNTPDVGCAGTQDGLCTASLKKLSISPEAETIQHKKHLVCRQAVILLSL